MRQKEQVEQLLYESIIQLLQTKSFSRITVGEICDNCGLSRRAFYNHFSDKYDLVAAIWKRFFESAWMDGDRLCSLEKYLCNMEKIWGESSYGFQSIYSILEGQNTIWETITEVSMEKILCLIRQNGYSDEIDEKVQHMVEFYCFGMTEMSKKRWYKGPEYQGYFGRNGRQVELLPEGLKALVLTEKPKNTEG